MSSSNNSVELYGSDQIDGNPDGIKRLGAWANGSFTPLSGAAFGLGRNGVTLSGNTRVTNADPNTDGAVFWPASGYRNWNTGAAQEMGLYGDYWHSTASTSTNGHHLGFDSTRIWPQWNNLRTHGFPVRCIRD